MDIDIEDTRVLIEIIHGTVPDVGIGIDNYYAVQFILTLQVFRAKSNIIVKTEAFAVCWFCMVQASANWDDFIILPLLHKIAGFLCLADHQPRRLFNFTRMPCGQVIHAVKIIESTGVGDTKVWRLIVASGEFNIILVVYQKEIIICCRWGIEESINMVLRKILLQGFRKENKSDTTKRMAFTKIVFLKTTAK